MVGRDISKSHAINRVRGITPTFATFDTDPPNPANMTDGDFTTESGEGIKALGAAGDIGFINFDIGVAYPVAVLFWVNAHRDSGDGAITCQLDYSNDSITWYAYVIKESIISDNYRVYPISFLYARYFRLYFRSVGTSVASVYHVKVAEVQALQLMI